MVNILKYYTDNPGEYNKEQQQRALNMQTYNVLAGRVAEQTEEDIQRSNQFLQDLNVFRGIYDQARSPFEFYKSSFEQEAQKEIDEFVTLRDDFVGDIVKESGPLTQEQRDMRDRYGMSIKPYIDPDTLELTTSEFSAWDARDYLAYGRENMMALSSVEQASIYNVLGMYSGNTDIFERLTEDAPDLFGITDEEQLKINLGRRWSGSWGRQFGVRQNAGFEGDQTEYLTFGENFREWFEGDTLPTGFLGGKKQEGWDAKKGYELLQQYHPGFAAYLDTVGLDKEKLFETPNHWEFRYQINNTVQMASLVDILNAADKDNNMLQDLGVFGANFLKQSFRSADMPVELGLTVLTLGGSSAVTAGRTIHKARKFGRMMKAAETAADKARVAGLMADSVASGIKNKKRLEKIQMIMVPSNWGHGIIRATTGAKFSGNALQRFGKYALADAGQGTVEGFLYGLQNQLHDGSGLIKWDRVMWETLHEAGGQIVFGKMFRMGGKGVQGFSDYTGLSDGVGGIWGSLKESLPPDILTQIEMDAQVSAAILRGDKEGTPLTREEIQRRQLVAILMAQQHTGFSILTGDESSPMPGTTSQMLANIQAIAMEAGVNLDVTALMEAVVAARPKNEDGTFTTLSQEEASILLVASALDNLEQQGLRIDPEESQRTVRGFVVGLLVDGEMRESGISPHADPDGYRKKQLEVLANLGKDPKLIESKIQALGEVATELRNKFGLTSIISIDEGARSIGLDLVDALTGTDGLVDTELLGLLTDGTVDLGELNLPDAILAAIEEAGRGAEGAGVPTTPEAPPAPDADTGDAGPPVEGEAEADVDPDYSPESLGVPEGDEAGAAPAEGEEAGGPAEPAPEAPTPPPAGDATPAGEAGTAPAEGEGYSGDSTGPEPAGSVGTLDVETAGLVDDVLGEVGEDADNGKLDDDSGNPVDGGCIPRS